jgi:hypothetical protein
MTTKITIETDDPAEVAKIARLDVQAGDTVVVKIDENLTAAEADSARDYIQPLLPATVRLLVLDKRMDLSVVRPQQPAKKR